MEGLVFRGSLPQDRWNEPQLLEKKRSEALRWQSHRQERGRLHLNECPGQQRPRLCGRVGAGSPTFSETEPVKGSLLLSIPSTRLSKQVLSHLRLKFEILKMPSLFENSTMPTFKRQRHLVFIKWDWEAILKGTISRGFSSYRWTIPGQASFLLSISLPSGSPHGLGQFTPQLSRRKRPPVTTAS